VELSTRTSPSGRYLAFNSVRGLTGGAGGTAQVFLYDAESGELSCVSCLPDGSEPPGPSALPGPIKGTELEAPGYLPRGLTNRGQLFFTTVQALLPSDTDGAADVYEYQPEAGLHLLSDGSGVGPSFFFDADENGSNLFFATSDALVGSDTDNALNIYDARVGGGFAEPPAPPVPCAAGESCRVAGGGSPPTGTVTTVGASGAGNIVAHKPCARGKVRRKGRCVKPSKHRGKAQQGKKRHHGKTKGAHR
jgi:hypothetical protein